MPVFLNVCTVTLWLTCISGTLSALVPKFLMFPIITNIWNCQIKNFRELICLQRCSTVILVCFSTIINEIEHHVTCLLAIWVLLFVNYIFEILPVFLRSFYLLFVKVELKVKCEKQHYSIFRRKCRSISSWLKDSEGSPRQYTKYSMWRKRLNH